MEANLLTEAHRLRATLADRVECLEKLLDTFHLLLKSHLPAEKLRKTLLARSPI